MAQFDWKSFNKEADKVTKFGGLMSQTDFADVTEWIGTGNYFLNAAMSGSIYGGIPNNRITALAGDSGTGKTYLLANIYAAAQKQGYYVVHFDSENDLTPDKMASFGLDLDKVRLVPVGTVEEFKHYATKMISDLVEKKKKGIELPKIIFGLDSLGMLASEKERSDAQKGEDKTDLTRAKEIRSTFRILTSPIAYLKMPMVIINHIYVGPAMFTDPTSFGGGGGLKYAASNILMLTKKQLKEGTEKSGIILKASPYKSRFVKPTIAEFYLRYDTGMNPYIGLQQYLSWENCGIEKGSFVTNKETGEIEFVAKETAQRWAVKHIGKTVTQKELFTSDAFTKDVLDDLEIVIKNDLKFSDAYSDEDISKFIVDDGEDDGIDS